MWLKAPPVSIQVLYSSGPPNSLTLTLFSLHLNISGKSNFTVSDNSKETNPVMTHENEEKKNEHPLSRSVSSASASPFLCRVERCSSSLQIFAVKDKWMQASGLFAAVGAGTVGSELLCTRSQLIHKRPFH